MLVSKNTICRLRAWTRAFSSSHKGAECRPAAPRFSFYKPLAIFGCTAVGLLLFFRYERGRLETKSIWPSNCAGIEMINDTRGSVGDALIGGQPFSLVDHTNSPITQDHFKGRFMLMYFGFTNCPDICPDELDKMVLVTDALDAKPDFTNKIAPVFVTVDPKRDTPEAIASYIREFSPKIVGITGSPDQMLDFARQHRVYCSINASTDPSTQDYLVDHSVFFYLMGPDGKFVDFFGREMTAPQIASKIEEWIRAFQL